MKFVKSANRKSKTRKRNINISKKFFCIVQFMFPNSFFAYVIVTLMFDSYALIDIIIYRYYLFPLSTEKLSAKELRNSQTKGRSLGSYRHNGRSYGIGNIGTTESSPSPIGNVVVPV